MFLIIALLIFPVLLKSQTGREFQRSFLNIKWTPTALFNPSTPVLLTGVEVWLSEKINVQVEYGHKATFLIKNHFNQNKENWYYQKFKFGFRYHYFPGLIRNSWWLLGRRSILPADRRSFIGLDFIHFPQSYRSYDDRVWLEDGRSFQYPLADVRKDAAVLTLVFGSQMRLGKQFFWEVYTGFGMKFLNMRHDFDQARSILMGPGSGLSLSGLSFEKHEGKNIVPFIDLGIKVGFEVLHK
ncbi:MAG: hypothetical protein AAFZ15_12815 [Bacteroidota bacterium]